MLLCPRDFPGKSSGVGCQFLLQGIFLTRGLNLCLLPSLADRFFTTVPSAKLKGGEEENFRNVEKRILGCKCVKFLDSWNFTWQHSDGMMGWLCKNQTWKALPPLPPDGGWGKRPAGSMLTTAGLDFFGHLRHISLPWLPKSSKMVSILRKDQSQI